MPRKNDIELWKAVTADVKRLKGRDYDFEESPEAKPKPAMRETVAVPPKPSKTPPAAKAKDVDARTDERLRKGKMPIQAKLDLHGYKQDEAHAALVKFIKSSYARGCRCVLVVTGKGRGGEGVLRRKVPYWLGEGELSPMVLKIHTARPHDGGEGALYVLLRRNR